MNTPLFSASSHDREVVATDQLTMDSRFSDEAADVRASVQRLKACKRELIAVYGKSEDGRAAAQVAATLLPLAALWGVAALALRGGYPAVIVVLLPLMSLFLLRVFALMHECGHRSLFRSSRLNRIFGFVFGVVSESPRVSWRPQLLRR